MNKNKFEIQDDQYVFPYHYIPNYNNGSGRRYRILSWGYKYLCYMLHAKEIAESLSINSILDVGCGEGRFFSFLNRNKYDKLVGVDLSEQAIKYAKAFLPDIEFHNSDASILNSQFDLVTALEVLEHIPDNETDFFIKTLAERVKENGYILITVPSKVIPLNDKHYRHYNLRLFKDELKSAEVPLKIIRSEYIFKENSFLKMYKRLTNNKFWFIDINYFNKKVWNYIWNKLRYGNENTGHNLVILLKKEI